MSLPEVITSYEQSPPIVCPGDKLVFTCVTDGSVRWRINGNNLQTVIMIDTSPPTTLGSFLLNVTQHDGNTGELVSTATNNSAPVSLNGTSIDCSGNGGGTFIRKYIIYEGNIYLLLLNFKIFMPFSNY